MVWFTKTKGQMDSQDGREEDCTWYYVNRAIIDKDINA